MLKKRNPELNANARYLRKNMTKEERHLWFDFLRDFAVPFHRQAVIGSFIVDFYCPAAKLVVELDGSQHYSEKGMEYDERRNEFLKSTGLTVKRHTNADIKFRFASVCEDIYSFVLKAGS